MSETDPFTEPAFTGRLQKLVPMLGSEQPGEADAARRKIIEHLAHHRLSFTDLANHLRDAAPRPLAPSFTQQAREASLERQLAIARQAKEEAAQEAEAAVNRVRVLEIQLQQVTFEIGRTLNSQARVRLAAAIACIVAAACLLVVVLPHSPAPRTPLVIVTHPQTVNGPGGEDPSMAMHPGEILGRAAVQDLAIRLAPNQDAATRAFLNYGEAVVIQSQIRVGQQTWLLIRSITGNGWVRSGDVLR